MKDEMNNTKKNEKRKEMINEMRFDCIINK